MSKAGGEPFSPKEFHAAVLRADMCAVASRYCFEHASRVVDELLQNFDVSRRPIKEKRTA